MLRAGRSTSSGLASTAEGPRPQGGYVATPNARTARGMPSPETQPSSRGSQKLTAWALPCSPEAGRCLCGAGQGKTADPHTLPPGAAPGEAPGPLSSKAHPAPTHASRQLFSSLAGQPSITEFLRKICSPGEKEFEGTQCREEKQ